MKASPSVCDLVVTILDFSLQEGEVCENDYLQIAEERLCGNIDNGMTRTYPFGNSDEILLSFDTDGSVGDKGFHISGIQRDCNATDDSVSNGTDQERKAQAAWDCDRTITGAEDSIRSPGFPESYPPDVDCRWMIFRADPRYCELEITIHSLHIQVGESCQFDYLEVDGHRFCGSTTAGNKRIFSFKSEQIVIHFHSDSTIHDRGFEVTLKQRECPTTTTLPASSSCDQVFDSKEFILVSPNHPQDYDNGVNCRYVIRRSSEDVCRLEMDFLRFDVESSSNCEYDYLAINGEKICGLIENSTRTYLFQDYEKQLTFHSDSGTSRPGFMIRVQQVDCSPVTTDPPLPPSKPCDMHFSTAVFEIMSDNHPSNYDPHLRCTYTVTRAHAGVCALELNFLSFDVEASDGCQYDYLKLQEEKLCGIYPANLKRIIPFEGNELILEFHSDGATSRPGFHIRGQQMDCAPLTDQVSPPSIIGSCDVSFTNASGTFQSPGFPESYPGPRTCIYRFTALPDRCRIAFQFLEFGLQAENALCE
ncbi:Cubilin, partial [Stegodyphus mimosarum]